MADKEKFGLLQASGDFVLLEATEGDKLPTFSATMYNGGLLNLKDMPLPVVFELKSLTVPNAVVPVCRDHNRKLVLGHSNVEIGANSIKATNGVLSGIGPHVDEVRTMAKNGFQFQASVGVRFPIAKVRTIPRGRHETVNGRRIEGPACVVVDGVYEESTVTVFGADNTTDFKLAAHANLSHSVSGDSIMTMTEWLKTKGIDEATTPEANMSALKELYKIEQTKAPAPETKTAVASAVENDPLQDVLDEDDSVHAHKKGIATLVASALKRSPTKRKTIRELAQRAVDENWSLKDTEMFLLCAGAPEASPFFINTNSSNNTPTQEIMEAAVCRTAGMNDTRLVKEFGEKTLEASEKQFKKGLGIQQAICLTARSNGWNGNGWHSTDWESALPYGFKHAEANAQSNMSLPGILGSIAQKFSREAFLFVERLWTQFAAVRSMKNFHAHSTFTLTGDLEYKVNAPLNEMEHGTLSETEYTNRLQTLTRQLCIGRQAIINDDLSVFQQIGKLLGRGCAIKQNKIVYGKITGNVHPIDGNDFFSVARGNYQAGSGTAFGNDGLIAADLLWAALTDPNGDPLGSDWKFIIHGPALKNPVWRMGNSTQFSDDSEKGSNNPWAGKFTQICSKYITSTTNYYLFADQNDMPVVEVGYLNGVSEPIINSTDMEAGKLGVIYTAVHDFSAELQEPRGGLLMKGSA